MRRLVLSLLILSGIGFARAADSAPAHAWPLWDGKESVAEYAKRTGLEPSRTLDLGNGVTMEFMLIPPGKFTMGTPKPVPVDEDQFACQIAYGQLELAAGAGLVLNILVFALVRGIRARRWPQLSLVRLLLMSALGGIAIYGGVHWWKTAQELDTQRTQFRIDTERYQYAAANEKPAHQVTLTKPYYMSKFEVTQAQTKGSEGEGLLIVGDNLPATFGFFDLRSYLVSLNLKSKHKLRIPTEAEWEYACRAGTKSIYYSGETEQDLEQVAWTAMSDNKSVGPQPVGKKAPNAFGLYDMHGNMSELCVPIFLPGTAPAVDPKGLDVDYLILRGGDCLSGPSTCRSAFRGPKSRQEPNPNWKTLINSTEGLRPLMEVEESAP